MWRMGIWRVRSPMSSRAQTVRSGAGGNLSRTRACGLTAKLFIGDSRNFDVEVNAVQQGAADFGEIALEMPGVQRHSRVESPLKPHGCGL